MLEAATLCARGCIGQVPAARWVLEEAMDATTLSEVTPALRLSLSLTLTLTLTLTLDPNLDPDPSPDPDPDPTLTLTPT